MPRRPRLTAPGQVYHVLNRAVRKAPLFECAEDFATFEALFAQAMRREQIDVLAYQFMGNHWHLLLRPHHERSLSRAMHWLGTTHASRWHLTKGTRGTGSVYQDRFKSFLVQEDGHLLAVWRYVERNALRAGFVRRAEDWPWGSLWQRRERGGLAGQLADWPDVTGDLDWWIRFTNTPQTPAELEAIRTCIRTEQPWGDPQWVESLGSSRASA